MVRAEKTGLTCLAVLIFAAHGVAGELPANLAWDDPARDVREKLTPYCERIATIDVEPVSFPLAEHTEQHLICNDFRSKAFSAEAMALVMADDRLVMIEAAGDAADSARATLDQETFEYLHFDVSEDFETFIDSKSDTVKFLSKAALHPNLFTWSNPALADTKSQENYEQSAAMPDLLDFGLSIDELRNNFEAQCPYFLVEDIENVWLPNEPASQTQINCFGFDYAGFPRKIEAVFGDGILEVAWILTGAPEAGRVQRHLVAAFGEPVTVNEKWDVFAGERVALRKDKAEVLMISERMRPYYVEDFK